MVALGALVFLPIGLVTAAAVLTIAAHNMFDAVPAAAFGVFAPVWTVLHAPGIVYSDGRHVVLAAYPLIPWIAVVAAGYGFGRVFLWEPEARRTFLLRLGSALTIGFCLLRAANVYGDPRPWITGAPASIAALSFLNTTKYPPSLLYLLMTLGPAMLFLATLQRKTPAWLRPARVFGQVPLFYFVTHVVLAHTLAIVVCYVRYGSVHWMFESPTLAQFPVTQPPGWPFGLPAVYGFWVLVVVMLYPLCRWFAAVKQRRTDWWLKYL
jgi:uncharacterized membrane protein